MPELVERIGLFTWAVLNLEAYSGSSIDFLPEDFTKIINGDYSSKAYKERWRDIENRYRCKDWYLGMIAQVEAEESLSKEVVKQVSEFNKDQVVYCTIWNYIDNCKKYTWRDFHVRDLVYSDKVFTLFIDNRNGIR